MSPPPPTEGPWLSVSAAARALGVSTSTLRLWASEGRVPHVRTAGGHRRFDPEVLRSWLARRPGRPSPPRRPASPRITPAPAVAAALRGRVEAIGEHVEGLVEGAAESSYRRLPTAERRSIVAGWVEALARAFESGDLSPALERAETYGRGHGLAGSSAEVTLGGSLALERGVSAGLVDVPEELRAAAEEAMGRLTARVATAWANAVAGRGGR